jgi:hypothetical protein
MLVFASIIATGWVLTLVLVLALCHASAARERAHR